MGRGYKKGSGKYEMTRGAYGGQVRVYKSGGTDFVKSPGASGGGEVVVYVDVQKLDKAWKKDGPGFYIPPGGGGAEIGGRRDGFREFRKNNPDKAVEMSRVYVDKNGRASFGDGRHRFTVFRDEGRRVIPVTTDPGASARRLQKLAGVTPQ